MKRRTSECWFTGLVAAVLILLGFPTAGTAHAQFGPSPSNPVAEMEGVEVRQLADIPNGGASVNRHPIRIAQDPTDGSLYVLATSQPDGRAPGSTNIIYRLDTASNGTFDVVEVLDGDDHGTPRPVGMTFGPNGSLYLVGNAEVGDTQTQIVIRRGTPSGGGWDWSTVATSEPYLLSYTYFDHRANAIVVTPDGSTLIVNSGSRTDHGESYGGVREEALTAVLLKIPADATELTIRNDREALENGAYVYAEGNRNTFDLAFAPNGDLFGPDNAGDRDDPGELNWLREGEHYGFPWRIGGNDTPMQFPGYDPSDDPLVSNACINDPNVEPADTESGCYFDADPNYPAPPEGVTFAEPVLNAGPYADKFLDPETGAVRDASEEDTTITTFSGGRAPQGLVFDADSLLEGRLEGGAFMLSFAGARGGFPEDGQDLAFLDLDKGEDGYTVTTEVVVTGFTHPIDAVMVDNVIYVVEYGDWFSAGGTRGVWSVTMPEDAGSAADGGPAAGRIQASVAPNPFDDRATVRYTLPQPAHVTAVVYDVLGREVTTLVDERRPAGEHSVIFEADGLAAGLYICRLAVDDEQRTLTVVRAR